MQIFHALGPIKRSLRSGVTNALKHRLGRNRRLCAQQRGKQARLIKSAFSLPSSVQWHRHHNGELASAKPFVIQRSMKPARYEVTQVNLPSVFKFMDDLANDPTTAVCRHRCVEVNRAMGAVGTGKLAGDGAFEGLGAFLAKWRDDADGLRFAPIAEILASSHVSPADCANWRVKKRYRRFQRLKLAKRDHISARFALSSTLLSLRPAAQCQQADSFPPMGGLQFADASAS